MGTKQFTWIKSGAGFSAFMPGEITLYVVPERTTGVLGNAPKRGTSWRAGVSRWDEATRTLSRYGRDVYSHRCANAKEARALAETVYMEG